jgi:hypothetical protein
VRSSIVLDRLKQTSRLPLGHLASRPEPAMSKRAVPRRRVRSRKR